MFQKYVFGTVLAKNQQQAKVARSKRFAKCCIGKNRQISSQNHVTTRGCQSKFHTNRRRNKLSKIQIITVRQQHPIGNLAGIPDQVVLFATITANQAEHTRKNQTPSSQIGEYLTSLHTMQGGRETIARETLNLHILANLPKRAGLGAFASIKAWRASN